MSNDAKKTLNIGTKSADSWIEILSAVKKSTINSINVGSLAYYFETVKKFDKKKGYKIIRVYPFPIGVKDEENAPLDVYVLNDIDFKKDDMGVIIYMDEDFREVIKNENKRLGKSENTTKHSKNYGVFINLTWFDRFIERIDKIDKRIDSLENKINSLK